MMTMRGLGKGVGRWRLLAAVAALAAALGLVAVAAAQRYERAEPARMALDEDLMRLAVVVMANQTPITQADAQAVLPALDKIQAQLEQDRAAGTPADDTAIASLDAELLAALTPRLRSAVDVVRLLTPPAPPAPGIQPRGMDLPPMDDGAQPGPPPGGPGRRPRGGGGHGPGGMTGAWMLGALVDFFRSAAGE